MTDSKIINYGTDAIAVIGIACRLPAAGNPRELWELLRAGRDVVETPDPERRAELGGDASGPAGSLDRIDLFDAGFFGISPAEAIAMDPRQRLVLELAWEAFEDAALDPRTLTAGRAGVFVGTLGDDYRAVAPPAGRYSLTGLANGLIANRVSYTLGLRGPSLTVDAAQASSLVAVHLAVQSLRRGESDLAVVGGVNLFTTPAGFTAAQAFGALSPQGRCRVFDAGADGFVRGEGGAAVLLKPLAAALADGDDVRAVILGSATNNDGPTATLTTPDSSAQEAVVRGACADGGVAPAAVEYVELHGTGTPVGDPVEAAALGAALGHGREAGAELRVGSIKTNIGHLEGAAGIAGLLKTILMLEHGELVPSLHFTRPPESIPLDRLGLRVQVASEQRDLAVASVSSFGMGGSNAHVVLGRAPLTARAPAAPDTGLPWVLSAREPAALAARAADLAPLVEENDGTLDDVAATLIHGRAQFEHRAAVFAGTASDLTAGLVSLAAGNPDPDRLVSGFAPSRGRRVAMIFSGHGALWQGMARELLDTPPDLLPGFAEAIDECAAALAPYIDWSVIDVLRGGAGTERIEVAQPAQWVMMVALARLWRSHGVEPAAVLGHSQGEIAAACVAGGLSLDDGARVVARRAQAFSAIEDADLGMAVVAAPLATIRNRLRPYGDRVSVGAVNGPLAVVLTGKATAVASVVADLDADGIWTRILPLGYASHCPQVEPVCAAIAEPLRSITPRSAQVQFYSTVLNRFVDTATLDAHYWQENLRRTVRFEDAVRGLVAAGFDAFVECSPHPVLVGPVRDTVAELGDDAVGMGTLKRDAGGLAGFRTALATAHVHGLPIDLDLLTGGRTRRRAALPNYPFQRKPYWPSSGTAAARPAEMLPEAPEAPEAPAPAPAPAPAAPRSRRELLAVVRAQTAAILGHTGVDDVPAGRTFRELGLGSLASVELRTALATALSRALPPTVLFDHPTPVALAAHLHDGSVAVQDSAPAGQDKDDEADPVAIVGLSCALPGGVTGPQQLWEFLRSGGDAISGFPADRGWTVPDDTYCRSGGFLAGAADFDAGFFGIAPVAALAMDPQQRLLLEHSWTALEDAGIAPTTLHGSATGVVMGTWDTGYAQLCRHQGDELAGHLTTGGSMAVVSGRVAFALGLTGSALTIDTACSSSLVALHTGVAGIRRGEYDRAIVGGATVMASPATFVGYAQQVGLAADGRCKAFAEDADGFGPAEGVVVVVLERLSAARAAGRPVWGIVRGSAVNSDGASNGLTAPSGPAQERVIRAALRDAGLAAGDIDVVEAHGTGTRLGDPIEAGALQATYGQAERPVLVGSIKSNLGHTQAAAGLAGLAKMLLAFREEAVPRSLHADPPSSYVDWETGSLDLVTAEQSWPTSDRPRRAAVSSFGISGTNAHVIVEEPPAAPAASAASAATGPVVWPISARSEAALRRQARQLASWVRVNPDAPAEDIAHTLIHGRDRHEHRAVLLDGTDQTRALAALAVGNAHSEVVTGRATTDPAVVFAFPGQGSQWAGMARELRDREPVFAAALAECGAALAPHVDWSLTDILAAPGEFERVEVLQPVLWAINVALAALWRHHGVVPDVVVGHSQGEIAAACVAGALSITDAATVVAVRSRLLCRIAGAGTMASVDAPLSEVAPLVARFGDRIAVAAVNGPETVVVSGSIAAVDEFRDSCHTAGLRTRSVPVAYAAHSAAVDELADELAEALAEIQPTTPSLHMWSTVHDRAVIGPELDATYWVRNLRETVRFHDAVEALRADGPTVFIECSAHPVLVPAMAAEASVGTLRRDDGGPDRFRRALAEAHVLGVPVDWRQNGSRLLQLPGHPFQRERFWPASRPPAPAANGPLWAAVEADDPAALAQLIGLDPEVAERALPALASWHADATERGATEAWRYRTAWVHRPDPEPGVLTGNWLLIAPDAPIDAVRAWIDATAAAVADAGGTAVPVTLAELADRTAVAERLRAALLDGPVAGIVSFLGLAATGSLAEASTALAATTGLVQGMTTTGIACPLWIVTTGAAEPACARHPAQATLWGLGRVLALESPQVWGGLVDVPLDPAGHRLVATLAAADGEDQIALADVGRRVPRLQHRTAPAARWRPRGTVLVTGGTGALAGHVAGVLAAHGATHLVLVSRRQPDADAATALDGRLGGVRVTRRACDVADRDAVAALLAEFGDELTAVVHTAAALDDGLVDELTAPRIAQVLQAKAVGATHLHELTAHLDLDAFVLFSSVSATVGVPGQGNYAPGNAYLDALAIHRRAAGLSATSIAWGPWAGGGVATSGSVLDNMTRHGLRPMTPELAAPLLLEVPDEPAVSVVDLDPERFHRAYSAARHRPFVADLPGAAPAEPVAVDGLPGRLAGRPRAQQLATVLDAVRSHVAAVLGHAGPEAVEDDRAFSALGLDSLTGVELRNRIGRDADVWLPATAVFDHPTPAALAERVLAELGAADPAPVVVAGPKPADDDPVVIVGVSCALPGGVTGPDELWELLRTGTDVVGELPTDRGWDPALFDPDPDRAGRSYSRHGAFLAGAAEFDAGFFEISPREALAMDPQQRMLLEHSWSALENAGIPPSQLRGSETGVFVGLSPQGYGSASAAAAAQVEGYALTGAAPSVASGRVAFALGLTGPALTIDTACSSSLVALHTGVAAIRRGECDLALVAGVTVMATPEVYVGFSRQRGLATDGRCKAFSAEADGFGPGEGVVVCAVERLSTARAAGRRVLAVVRGSAVNSDGASNGLTAPNGAAQERVIRAALRDADLSTEDVDMVEAHGTGTRLGDPIEVAALQATYGLSGRSVVLGSVKTNVGHTQAAAGLVGLVKVLLAMWHGVVPRTLHCAEPSPLINWSAGSVVPALAETDWPAGERVRRAAVSSFGISGTNVHVIVEEPPGESATESAGAGPVAWPVSARSTDALRAQVIALCDWLVAHPDTPVQDVARTLATRDPFEHRVVAVGENRDALLAELAGATPAVATTRLRIGMVLSEPAAPDVLSEQLVGTPAFDETYGRCLSALPELTERGRAWAVLVGLGAVWKAHGVIPEAVVGTGVGQLAAECLAGVHTVEAAARLLAMPPGPGELPDGITTVLRNVPLTDELPLILPPERGGLLRALAEAFERGLPVDWRPAADGRLLDLPSYAFQRRRYWLTPPAATQEAATDWRYTIEWEPHPELETGVSGRWLVAAAPGDPRAEAMSRVLEARGATALPVPLDVAAPDRAAWTAALTEHGAAVGVLAVLDTAPAALTLAQAMIDVPGTSRLWHLTRAAVSTTGEAPDPDAAMVWGIGQVFGLEHPQRWGGLIDIGTPSDADAAVGLLAGEEDQLAVRAGRVLRRRLVRAAPAETTTTTAPRGTVLVTGGTGGIGGHVARWLVGAGADHVVLLSRGGPAAPGAAELVAELAALGPATVSVRACDVADRDELATVLASLDGPVSAVFHTAGLGQVEVPLADMPVDELERVAAAKVRGARNLDELAGDAETFVLFSSIAATWGGGGQGGYSAANAYLDALAVARRARGRSAVSVAWGIWDGPGMADGAGKAELARRGVRPMAPAAALAQLRTALGAGNPCLVVADIEWPLFGQAFAAARRRPLLDRVMPAVVPAAAPAEPDATPTNRDVLALIVAEIAETLGHDDPTEVGPDRPFEQLGVDSMAAVELSGRLTDVLGRDVPVTDVFDHPSPAELAAHLSAPNPADVVERLRAAVDDLAAELAAAADAGVTQAELHALTRRLAAAPEETLSDESIDALIGELDRP